MTTSFGPWSTAIHEQGKALLATFWRQRFRSLSLMSGPPRPSRVPATLVMAMAALSFSVPTLLAEPAQVEEAVPAARPAAADQQDASNAEESIRRPERLKQLERNVAPQVPQARRPDIEKSLSIKFVESPADNTFEFLSDAYRVQIVLSRAADEDRKVNLDIAGKPLRDSLEMVCTHLQFDWETDGYVVFVGPKASVTKFRGIVRTREERRRKYPAALAGPLQERVKVDFVEQPIEPAVRFLAATTTAPIRVARHPAIDNEKLSFATRGGGLPIDVILDLISVEFDLRWKLTDAGALEMTAYVPDEA